MNGVAAHWILEAAAYAIGFRVFLLLRKRRGDAIPETTRITVIAGAALGAALGAKLLAALMDPVALFANPDPRLFLAGKTVVGGILGGLAGTELTKLALGEHRSTGDLVVLPLCLAMSIGRVGCFLAGLADDTVGTPTSLPWGVDFGDGIPRHPAQLYEIGVLALIALWASRRTPLRDGDLFKGFLLLYLAWRVVIDFWKPEPRIYAGLSAIQVAALVTIAVYARHASRVFFAAHDRTAAAANR